MNVCKQNLCNDALFISSRINFTKMTHIILDEVSQVLRITFRDTFMAIHGKEWQFSDGETLKKEIKKAFPDQQKLLDEGDPNEWDPTLLCLVLLHNKTWKKSLGGKKEQAVQALRDARNKYFGHPPRATASSADLNTIVMVVEDAYKSLLDGKVEKEPMIMKLKKIATGKF